MLALVPHPIESFTLLCVRCRASLFYTRQDRTAGIPEHHYQCRRCGQKHAAWSYDWESSSPRETPSGLSPLSTRL